LYKKKDEDPLWIVRPKIDSDERRLTGLFWMSPAQVCAYEKFHDVIVIDTTSKTNQFDMILFMITAVDNNFKNLIVAAALIEDETEATFAWILDELKIACEVTPTVIYSDLDSALVSAISNNYPETCLFHCIFHIDLNLKKIFERSYAISLNYFSANF